MGERRASTTYAEQVVALFDEDRVFDADVAAMALFSAVSEGDPVQLDKRFAMLIWMHLSGALPSRRGKRRSAIGIGSPLCAALAKRYFDQKRAKGVKYDAVVAEIARRFNVSRASVEKWVSPNK